MAYAHGQPRLHSEGCYYKTKRDVKALLHIPDRGAFSELEVLELLELARIPDSDILDMLELELMGPAEINVLVAILVDQEHADRTKLLRKTVRHQLHGVVEQYHDSNNLHCGESCNAKR